MVSIDMTLMEREQGTLKLHSWLFNVLLCLHLTSSTTAQAPAIAPLASTVSVEGQLQHFGSPQVYLCICQVCYACQSS